MKKLLLLLVLGWVPNHAFIQTTAELYRTYFYITDDTVGRWYPGLVLKTAAGK